MRAERLYVRVLRILRGEQDGVESEAEIAAEVRRLLDDAETGAAAAALRSGGRRRRLAHQRRWASGLDLPLAAPRLCHLGPAQPGARIEDVSRLMGPSTVRVTQDLYISPDGDLFKRFYRATA